MLFIYSIALNPKKISQNKNIIKRLNKLLIAIWALTYLFDEEELIYDSIPFFGYQDDWLVLNAAIRLIKTSKNNNHGLLQN